MKYGASGSWDGGPTRELLLEIRGEEIRHFHLLKSAMESIGADATAMTPSADIVGVESMGLVQVVTDPRMTLPQSLHAMMVAKLADGEGWNVLADLAMRSGHEAMADSFRNALRAEVRHLEIVRQWVAGFTSMSAQGEAESAA
jgi:hypothetical protein